MSHEVHKFIVIDKRLTVPLQKALEDNLPRLAYETHHLISPAFDVKQRFATLGKGIIPALKTPTPTLEYLQIMEHQALCALIQMPEADVALVWSDGTAVPPDVSSMYRGTAMLVEKYPKGSGFGSMPFFAKIEEPFLGETGSTPQQQQRAAEHLVSKVVAGWINFSRRYDSILSRSSKAA